MSMISACHTQLFATDPWCKKGEIKAVTRVPFHQALTFDQIQLRGYPMNFEP